MTKKSFFILSFFIAVNIFIVRANSSMSAESKDASGTKLVYPNVYTAEEQKILDEFKKSLEGGGRGGGMPGGGAPGGAGGGQGGAQGSAPSGGQGGGQGGGTMLGTAPDGAGKAQLSTDTFMGMTADKAAMKKYAKNFDPWNPLYNDEEYAKKTKYGSIIAVPFFKEAGAMFPSMGNLKGLGNFGPANDGGDIEFFLPIHPGDTFTMKSGKQSFEDITPKEGSTSRVFRLIGSGSLVNQKGETVITGTMYGRNTFSQGGSSGGGFNGPPPSGTGSTQQGASGAQGAGGAQQGSGGPQSGSKQGAGSGSMGTTRHTYTEADWALIKKIWKEEKVRGSEILYWEDVKVGDEPAWVTTGPTTITEMVRRFGDQMENTPLTREMIENPDRYAGLTYDQYNIPHVMEEVHWGDMGRTGGTPSFYMAYGLKTTLVRVISNYVGDDGWLRKLSWRNGSLATDEIISQVPYLKGKNVTGHGGVSDCLIGKAYVTKKYVADDGTHRVDLVVWDETIDGLICQSAIATVILVSKADKKSSSSKKK